MCATYVVITPRDLAVIPTCGFGVRELRTVLKHRITVVSGLLYQTLISYYHRNPCCDNTISTTGCIPTIYTYYSVL